MPADMMEAQPWILPFCANFFRCVAGLIGFSLLMMVSRHVDDFKQRRHDRRGMLAVALTTIFGPFAGVALDRKSTRLNSSHANISYAVFCLKKNTFKPLNYHL